MRPSQRRSGRGACSPANARASGTPSNFSYPSLLYFNKRQFNYKNMSCMIIL